MGLKTTMKEQMHIESSQKTEDLHLIQELTAKLEEAQKTIQTLQLKNSTLQSDNQKMQSAVMTAQKEIESLTNRAASVNATELKNKELLRKATEAKALADKALLKAQQESYRAERAFTNEKKERESRIEEAKNRREAEQKATQAERAAGDTKSTFKNLFIGNAIFTAALALFMLYDRWSILAECGGWFADRGKGIAGFVLWLKSAYMGMAHGMEGWKWPAPLCFILTTLIFLFIVAALGYLLWRLFPIIAEPLCNILVEYDNGLFKAAISADVALILFFFCIWFYIPIKAVLSWNIFSSWILFSALGVLGWNSPEIVRGLKNG